MKRAGVVDLSGIAGNREGVSGSLSYTFYVFRNGSSGYELERLVSFSAETEPLHDQMPAVEETCLSLPLDLVDFRILELPFSDREKLKKVIPFELDALIMDRSDSVVFDTYVLGRSEKGFSVLVAYVRADILGDLLVRLRSHGIDPKIITSLDLEALIKEKPPELTLRLLDSHAAYSGDRGRLARESLSSCSINLRSGRFAYTKDDEKFRKMLKVMFVLLLLLVMVIHADLTFRIITSNREASLIRRDMRSAYTALFPDDKKITDELYQAKAHLKELKEKGDAVIGVNPLDSLRAVAERVSRVSFNEINLDGGLVVMKGQALSMDDVSGLKQQLSEVFADVSVSDISSSGGRTLFTVVAKPVQE